MFTKDSPSLRRAGLAVAATAVGAGLLLSTGTSATAATPAPSSPAVAVTQAASVHASSDVLPPFVGVVYTGQVGPGSTFTPQFSGPISTPTNPNPPTQYVHITAGNAGATVATSLAIGTPQWSAPWVLGPGASMVIPVQSWFVVGIADVPTGAPGSFTVTSITGS